MKLRKQLSGTAFIACNENNQRTTKRLMRNSNGDIRTRTHACRSIREGRADINKQVRKHAPVRERGTPARQPETRTANK
ncbi:Uncharacterized protein BM_BM10750 [Brugia malayi]|uniref:Bm10750 n=1 Tax=Brugia malayi TaxID=6279 RepID=A0A0H5SAT0_BRUMA|nr:Uncharacterized protein BM_BM10750 [Brugia malayi]CRZ25464.1 Bm10750 [Brugia malayi]VIO99861.1 Uncharacterized protein BM_BM10750 [Brugia malayi]